MSTIFLENSGRIALTPFGGAIGIQRMGSFGKALKRLRESRFMTQEELAAAADVSAKSISTWEGSAGPTIQGTKYAMLAKALGMTTAQLDQEWRADKIDQTVGDPVRRGIPLINKAPAGGVVDYHECSMADSGQGHWYIARGNLKDPHAFAVEIVGDSMEPGMKAGSIAVFSPIDKEGFIRDPRVQIEEGHIVFVRFGPDAKEAGCCVARWYRKGAKIQLKKDNPKYKPKAYDPPEIIRMAALINVDVIPGVREVFAGRDQLQTKGDGDKQVEGKVHHDIEAQEHPSYD